MTNTDQWNQQAESGKRSMRSHLINELVMTQKRFATDMNHLVKAMHEHQFELDPNDRESLFINLRDVAKISADLDELWNQLISQHSPSESDRVLIAVSTLPFIERLRDVFLTYSTKFDVNLVINNASLEKFSKYVVECLRKNNQVLVDLNSQLIRPVQRIIKYEQLFEKLMDETSQTHGDYEATYELYEAFHALLRQINENKRWNKMIRQIFDSPNIQQACNQIIFINRMPSDGKLAREKIRLIAVREAVAEVHKWIGKRFYYIQKVFIAERDSIKSIWALCDSNRRIIVHTRASPSCSYQMIQSQVFYDYYEKLQLIIRYFDNKVKQRLDRNVLPRLDELLNMLTNPELVFDELHKTEKELQLTLAKNKNQSITALTDREKELMHTKQTIETNLLKELSMVLWKAEDILSKIISYTYLLSSRMMEFHASSMKSQMSELNRFSGEANAKTGDSHTFADNFIQAIQVYRVRNPTSHVLIPNVESKRKSTVNSLFVARSKFGKSSWSQFELPQSSKRATTNQPTRQTPTTNAISPERRLLTDRATKATHFALFDYVARSQAEVNMKQGQHVTLLDCHDQQGNSEWFRVTVFPKQQTGYVPAAYLKSFPKQ